MPRPPRIDYPGARHHVKNGGARHQNVFGNDASRLLFLDLLGDVVNRYEIAIHAYALMPNHFHLALESVRGNLSRAMQNLQFRYSQEVNRIPGLDGALFSGRFKSNLVLDEAHWFYLPLHLHLNPVRSRMVNHPDHFPWTSHLAYLNEKKAPTWLITQEMNEHFNTGGGYATYLQAAMNGNSPIPRDFDAVLFHSRQTAKYPASKQPESKPPLLAESALEQVAALCGCEVDEILSTKRGTNGNPARALSIWWLIKGAGQTNSEVGRIMNISPSAVSKILKKLKLPGKQYLGGKPALWQDELKRNINRTRLTLKTD